MTRNAITVNLGEVEEGSLDVLEAQIKDVRQRAMVEGITDLKIEFDTERGYYGDSSITVRIFGLRDETDEEMQMRLGSQEVSARRTEAKERAEYERLKKKFAS